MESNQLLQSQINQLQLAMSEMQQEMAEMRRMLQEKHGNGGAVA